MIGKRVIVRGDRSGVFFGTLKSVNGQTVELTDFRKLHYWDGASAVEELSLNGTCRPNNCRFTVFVKNGIISDMIQLLECTEEASKSIEQVEEWTQK